ncbi:HEPN domain-containing protein [bacterium]|nr:HEPN domain-containing protein [bacterium]
MQIARENFANRRYSFAMFLAHLALEKALKALVINETKAIPPRIHNLTSLAEKAKLSLDQETLTFLSAMDHYQMAGRYPEPRSPMISRLDAEWDLKRAEEVVKCLTSQ